MLLIGATSHHIFQPSFLQRLDVAA
jgi:hypothetical protein